MPARMAREAVGAEVFDAYYRFAIERNPWDAVVSAYYWSFRDQRRAALRGVGVDGDQVDNLAKNAGIYRLQGEIAVHRRAALRVPRRRRRRGLGPPRTCPARRTCRTPRAAPARATPTTGRCTTDASRERVAAAFERTIADLGYEF